MSANRSQSVMSNRSSASRRKALQLRQQMGGYTQLPTIRSRSTSPTKASFNPGCPWDRFTKLKGTLVNNLLAKYNKEGGKRNPMRPDLVYNVAIMAVEDILKKGKMTEESLRQMQENFSKGVMNIPRDWTKQHGISTTIGDGGAGTKNSSKQRMAGTSSKPLTAMSGRNGTGLMSRGRGGGADGADAAQTGSLMQRGMVAIAEDAEGGAGEEMYERGEGGAGAGVTGPSRLESGVQADADGGGGGGGGGRGGGGGGGESGERMKQRRKTVPEMDEWTKMILLKDVKHIENEKKKKKAKEHEKTEQAKFLDMQLQWREKEKLTYKEDKLEYARMLERKSQELEAEKRAAEEKKKAKVAESKRQEARQIEEIKRRREEEAEREKRDAEEQLAIYAAQIEAEKVQQKEMQLVKLKQYAEVVKENDKALAKKRERKAAEAAEQERLFKIQNDMYDKQERIRLEAEEMRMQRLKNSERQGQELANKMAEMERKVHMRFLEAQAKQERLSKEDEERKAEKKRKADEDMKLSLQQQLAHQEMLRRQEEEEKREIAKQYQRDAKQFADEKRQEKVRAAQQRKAAAAMLAQQIKVKKQMAKEVVMTQAEKAINLREVQEVQPIEPDEMLAMYQAATESPPKK